MFILSNFRSIRSVKQWTFFTFFVNLYRNAVRLILVALSYCHSFFIACLTVCFTGNAIMPATVCSPILVRNSWLHVLSSSTKLAYWYCLNSHGKRSKVSPKYYRVSWSCRSESTSINWRLQFPVASNRIVQSLSNFARWNTFYYLFVTPTKRIIVFVAVSHLSLDPRRAIVVVSRRIMRHMGSVMNVQLVTSNILWDSVTNCYECPACHVKYTVRLCNKLLWMSSLSRQIHCETL